MINCLLVRFNDGYLLAYDVSLALKFYALDYTFLARDVTNNLAVRLKDFEPCFQMVIIY